MYAITGKAVLITGANRGVGHALVKEALRRGAGRVYAGTRSRFAYPDERVKNLILDVTDAEQRRAAVAEVDRLDVLVNNAGISLFDDLSDRTTLERQLAVNLFGPYEVTQAFLPLLTRAQGRIVNVLSLAALASLPNVPGYSVSKAAAFSLTQSLRALLAGRGVGVHGVVLGPTDTDMNRDFDIPKATTESVAHNIFDGIELGDDEIFPDPVSAAIAESWRASAVKALEREFAAFVPESVAS
jgi:NAD(P)-dependent dehydrogenase (short-subunit alcohol dehydrogenase family)